MTILPNTKMPFLFLGTALAFVSLVGCKKKAETTEGATAGSKAEAQSITIKGSDTMVTLGQRWAEVYMQKFPAAIVQVTGGGTGTGISALINGTTDICQASRKMKEKEQKLMVDKHGAAAVEIEVARDGLAVYVNNANKIEEISFAQLKDIFRGKVTNWKDVGGGNFPIVIYSRENSSGTYEFFKETVLGGEDFAATAQTMPGTAAVVNAVSKETNGIGYGGAAYGSGIKPLRVKKDPAGVSIAPTEATVKDGTYPLARPLQIYLLKTPEGSLKAFTDWIKGPEGQKLVTEVGYYPI